MNDLIKKFLTIENEYVPPPPVFVIDRGVINHIRAIIVDPYDPEYWSKLNVKDKAAFSARDIHKKLSLSFELIRAVNEIQQHEIPDDILYKLYANLPMKKGEYEKIKNMKQKQHNKELISIISGLHKVSLRQAKKYIDLYKTIDGKETLSQICRAFGKTENEVIKLLN